MRRGPLNPDTKYISGVAEGLDKALDSVTVCATVYTLDVAVSLASQRVRDTDIEKCY